MTKILLMKCTLSFDVKGPFKKPRYFRTFFDPPLPLVTTSDILQYPLNKYVLKPLTPIAAKKIIKILTACATSSFNLKSCLNISLNIFLI
jgi:hypothetical protein